MHYRSNRGYTSQHGGRAFYCGKAGGGGGSADDLHKSSLKASGSAVMLSEMEKEGSYHG